MLLGVSVAALAAAGTASAAGPPASAPPGTPSISQYVETVPTSRGGTSAGVGKAHRKALSRRVTAGLRASRSPVTKQLEAVATSSAYGAPQRNLTPPSRTHTTKRMTKRTTNRIAPRLHPPAPTKSPPNALSAAVSAVGGSGDNHLFLILAALIVVTTGMVWTTARRHRS